VVPRASGAGKTTLLDVLARRKTLGKVEGELKLNGRPLEIDFERITGYVEQMDVFNPALTVREALRFSAKLRQDAEIPNSEKYEYAEKILEMMEMKHLGDALIGSLETGTFS
jgi:ABC-type multidrug transport system ATPase subunit